MRASLLKALTVFSPRGNALIEGRVKVDGQGSAMTQQRRGVLVQFGGAGRFPVPYFAVLMGSILRAGLVNNLVTLGDN